MDSTFQSPPAKVSKLSFAAIGAQFSGLTNDPGRWPILPRALVWLVVVAVVMTAAWFFFIAGSYDELEAERSREPTLKADYRDKLVQAVNLEELRRQKAKVEEYVKQLERQLPGKAEMDALLTDINSAGLGRGLQFESFRPRDFVARDYYGEKLISIVVTGGYHDFGAFAADIAGLSRIVTLDEISITSPPGLRPGALMMSATARAYRYLDESEIQQVQQDSKKKGAR